MRVNDYRRAQHALELALATEPNSAALLNDLGFVYFQQNKISAH
jgi:Flp pilus assembly protein TadD